jgi:hypothetical protein
MSASSLNICDSAKQISYHKIFTDGLKVYCMYMLKIQYVRDKNRPQHYLKQGKNLKNVFFFLLCDDADSAKQSSNTNN